MYQAIADRIDCDGFYFTMLTYISGMLYDIVAQFGTSGEKERSNDKAGHAHRRRILFHMLRFKGV